ncbi:uncharacterized protein TRIADDRAFT_59607 [Trichoplax adhaerens]|uniref:Leucine-rich repeat-containing protein 63 n=1 Tax=Trichoplax adhaerens TaxID=10228 RepID=B3S5G5_TRIAD|nr:hypothetical protein TRIADDRAFT_59607 [Trichoplax adhaerens]EDV22037.1 hypothetical protein TRIADDRAFT_59607 [Trichoplax adhaerens]|eukprot:XP_002115674.1 hypothetical protein TRIADDRAFT_59607 [Trichoplax adhaerens]
MAKSKLLRRPLAPAKSLPPTLGATKEITSTESQVKSPNITTISSDSLSIADSKLSDKQHQVHVLAEDKAEDQAAYLDENQADIGAPTPHTSFVEETSIVGNKLLQSLTLEDIEFVKEAGPDPLPRRRYTKPTKPTAKFNYQDQYGVFIKSNPIFTLDDFKLNPKQVEGNDLTIVARSLMLSKKNYDEMVAIFARNSNKTLKPAQVSVDDIDLPAVKLPRRPYKQLLIESKKEQLDEYVRGHAATPGASSISYTRSSSSWKVDAHTESEYMSKLNESKNEQSQDLDANFPLLAMEGNLDVNPSEAAVFNCMIQAKGFSLSLKAYFISSLPNLSPVFQTLRWLNLSFNNFTEFPSELYELKYLEVLYLRNNPIPEIPTDIDRLSNLKTLGASHCLLNSLPERNLRILNLEGNEIVALPCDVMNLDLKHLYIANNYIHPLFWANYTKNDPQPLKDITAIVFRQSGLHLRYQSLPENIEEILSKERQCLCCGGPIYGEGLKVIRPAGRMFGVHTLPLIFRSCSPYCRIYYNQVAESLIYKAMEES